MPEQKDLQHSGRDAGHLLHVLPDLCLAQGKSGGVVPMVGNCALGRECKGVQLQAGNMRGQVSFHELRNAPHGLA